MMIEKIISGGQTGAGRAALDAAIQWKISHGGWIPKGRQTESGRLPDKYKLQEMETNSYLERTEQNVIDSDGTLIISHGPLTGSSKYTEECALKHHRPCLHIELNNNIASDAAKYVYQWITRHNIETLNVAGPRASKDPYIYQATMHLITAVLHFDLIKAVMPDSNKESTIMPQTVNSAVEMLISKIQLKDSVRIANMQESDLIYLHLTLGNYIRNTFGLLTGNETLMQNCKDILGKKKIQVDEASYVIIRSLWKRVHETHVMRVIK
jgi:hypothetical protein